LYRKTLLCVEKNGGRVEARCAALEGAGYKVIAAQNVSDALKIFVSQTIDAVLIDAKFGTGKKDSHGVVMSNIRPYVPIIVMRGEDGPARTGAFAHIFRKREGNRALLRLLKNVMGDAEFRGTPNS
jgi:DNA-binding NtrC family response regulator